jgi:hypothetical protein
MRLHRVALNHIRLKFSLHPAQVLDDGSVHATSFQDRVHRDPALARLLHEKARAGIAAENDDQNLHWRIETA